MEIKITTKFELKNEVYVVENNSIYQGTITKIEFICSKSLLNDKPVLNYYVLSRSYDGTIIKKEKDVFSTEKEARESIPVK